MQRGETAEVVVRVDWHDRSGPQSSAVYLVTDEPNAPVVKLALQGNVELPAQISPSVINFGDIPPGGVVSRAVEVAAGYLEHGFSITNVTTRGVPVDVTRGEPDDPPAPLPGTAGRFTVTMRHPLSGASGSKAGVVTFHTNLADGAVLRVNVVGNLLPAITASPASLFFSGRPDAESRKEILFKAPTLTGRPTALIEGESSSSFIVESIRDRRREDGRIAVLVAHRPQGDLSAATQEAKLRFTIEGANDSAEIPLFAAAPPNHPSQTPAPTPTTTPFERRPL